MLLQEKLKNAWLYDQGSIYDIKIKKSIVVDFLTLINGKTNNVKIK